MRICLFTPVFLPVVGGIEVLIHELACRLHRQGHDVTVLAARKRGVSSHVEAPYRIRRYWRPFSKRVGVEQLLLPLLRERWGRRMEVLHCHAVYPHGYLGGWLKRWTGTPVVITAHGIEVMAHERVQRTPWLARRVAAALAGANVVTAISRYMAGQTIQAGADAQHVRVVYNGIDLTPFTRPHAPHPWAPYVLGMGVFRRTKGFDVLIRAFQQIAGRFPQVSLVLAGGGKEDADLRHLARACGLEGRVRFVGFVTGEDKVRLLHGCEFFVCPSVWQEPFGLVNVEALAAGKGVLGTRVGAVPEIIVSGETGWLVDGGDVEALADGLAQWLGAPGRYQALREACRAAARRFDIEETVRGYGAVYQEVVRR